MHGREMLIPSSLPDDPGLTSGNDTIYLGHGSSSESQYAANPRFRQILNVPPRWQASGRK